MSLFMSFTQEKEAIMSITLTRESVETTEKSLIEKRQAEVAQIVAKHSQKVFGHPHSSISEVRNEAVKRRLETIFAR